MSEHSNYIIRAIAEFVRLPTDEVFTEDTREALVPLFMQAKAQADDMRARLAAFEAREPLVQALIVEIDPGEYPPAVDPQWPGAAPDFYPLDAKARAVRDFHLQPSAAPPAAEPSAGDGDGAIGGVRHPGGFVDGALERTAKLLADNPGIDLCWGLESDAVHLAAEVRRLREFQANLRVHVDEYHEHAALKAERDQLRAEVAELREIAGRAFDVTNQRNGLLRETGVLAADLENVTRALDLARDQLSALLATLRVAVKDAEARNGGGK